MGHLEKLDKHWFHLGLVALKAMLSMYKLNRPEPDIYLPFTTLLFVLR